MNVKIQKQFSNSLIINPTGQLEEENTDTA